ncbi:MAG: serine protease, partial [Acidobacteria bacterium]|nr:serine protease [Acidobacteriota bacterium]
MKREILHILMVSFLMVTALSGGTRAGVVDLQPAAAMVRIVTGEVDDGQLRGQTSGAGVIISAEGAVLTTRQAIRMADGRIAPVLWALMPETEGTVSLNRAVRLRLIAASVETDLALLQLVFRQGRESAVPFVSLAVDDRIDYGAKVTLLGFTSANGSSIVRRQSTILDFDERNANAEWIVVAGRIDQQSTGGPVLNDQGRLVGLQTAVWQNRPVPFFGDDDFPIGL